MSITRCLSFASLVMVLAPTSGACGAATITVNTTLDEDVDNQLCSLREAITAANNNADYHGCVASGAGVNDLIVFALGPGTPTLNISSTPLPAITQWVTIDGGPNRVELHGPGGPPVSQAHGLTVVHEGFGTTIRNLVINNFADDGIFINNADEVSVLGCFIGTDATGMMAVPNQGFGVQVLGGNGVRIGGATSGGPCTGDCNVISGAKDPKANVLIDRTIDLTTQNALVRGNFIGPDVTGTAGITPQNVQGIIDKGMGTRIGGSSGTTPGGACTGDCNLISGNNINGGLVIHQAAVGSVIQGNFIGTDVTGTSGIGNGLTAGFSLGILSLAGGPTIGGTTPEARNVVSGNKGVGIQINGINTIVTGNYIGTNSAGTAPIPDSGPGITVFQASSAFIGGVTPGAGNLISGASNNGGFGIEIAQSGGNQVVGNLIGTAADGTSPLPNVSGGVFIDDESSNNLIGGVIAGAGNVIAFNGLTGVRLDGSSPPVRNNTIRGNSIYSNEEAGIALFNGANDDLAAPIIQGVNPLHGTSCAPCTVEIFSDAEDEGRIFEGSVFTNDGTWMFDGPLTGPNITATNTDMSNNTSTFSDPVPLRTATLTPSRTPSFTQIPTATGTATRTATLSQTATATPTRTATATRTASQTNTPVFTPTQTRTGSATATSTSAPTSSTTVTAIPSNTSTPAPSPTSTASATVSPTPVACVGDCRGVGSVGIADLILGVNISLGLFPVSACPAFANAQGDVDIAQLIKAVNNSLNGC